MTEIEQLEAENAALRADVEKWKSLADAAKTVERIANSRTERDAWLQLAASQAREQQLREALKMFAHRFPESSVAKEALALPSDTSALEALITKAGEAMRDRVVANLLRCGALGDGEYLNAIRAFPAVTLDDLKGGEA